LKSIYAKRDGSKFLVHNISTKPEIVLVFPITRDTNENLEKWKIVIDFVKDSEIRTLLVLDKTESGSATEFFMSHFASEEIHLVVLPRNIKDTLFDTVGEIVLDKNLWIIQLHDDDNWSGKLSLPEIVDPETVYYSDFYLNSASKGLTQIQDYSMPNRIVFSLVPSNIWNRFTSLVQAQQCHVAGSFDFTLNLMTQIACKFEYRPGFVYHWNDDNWDTSKNAKAHLSRLAVSDGWKGWSSPEIANLNRTIDSLASLNYLQDIVTPDVIEIQIQLLICSFQPSFRNRIKLCISIPIFHILYLPRILQRLEIIMGKSKVDYIGNRLRLYKFVKKTWRTRSLEDVLDLVIQLQAEQEFESLHNRFLLWKESIRELSGRN
jgi:hypothetical protein